MGNEVRKNILQKVHEATGISHIPQQKPELEIHKTSLLFSHSHNLFVAWENFRGVLTEYSKD